MRHKLRQLCTARALAATIATGLLMSAAVLAQDHCFSAAAIPYLYFLGCGANQISCSATDPCGHTALVIWCCDNSLTCGPATQGLCEIAYPYSTPPYAYGWCCPGGGGG